MISAGGTSGAVLNAANEVAVRAFLDREIGFLEIADLVRETLDGITPTPVTSLDDVFAADREARARARGMVHA